MYRIRCRTHKRHLRLWQRGAVIEIVVLYIRGYWGEETRNFGSTRPAERASGRARRIER